MIYTWSYLVLAILLVQQIVAQKVAIAYLVAENITGMVEFTETEGGVRVTGSITGLGTGKYGFHVHELGDVSTCDAAGAHFNPEGTNHGGPDHNERHVGDLGNIEFDGTGTANIDFVDTLITLDGHNSILGRSLMLHAGEDDLGLGGHETSLTTGNAGARVACAVIGIKSPSEPWSSAAPNIAPSLLALTFVLTFVLL